MAVCGYLGREQWREGALKRLIAGARARKFTLWRHPLFSAGRQAAQHDSTNGMPFTPAWDEGIDDRGRIKFEPAC